MTLQVGLMNFQRQRECRNGSAPAAAGASCPESWLVSHKHWGKTRFWKCLHFIFSVWPNNLPVLSFSTSKYRIGNNFFTATWLALGFDVCIARDAIGFAFCLLLLQQAISHTCHLQRGKDRMETEQRKQHKRKSGIFPKAHLMYKYKQEKDVYGGRSQELC